MSISESTMAPPQPYAYAAAEAQDRADGAVPLAPGTKAVAVEVQVVYAFDVPPWADSPLCRRLSVLRR